MPLSCYRHDMANLQVKNVPDALHERLRRHALENGCTMSSVVLTALERELERLDWQKRFAQYPATDPGVDAATLLAEARALRDLELETEWPDT